MLALWRMGIQSLNAVRPMNPIPTGPATHRKVQAGPRRGSDASQCSDRSRVHIIEQCAGIAESYTNRRALSTHAMAKDIAAEIRALADRPMVIRGGTNPNDFPWWAFV